MAYRVRDGSFVGGSAGTDSVRVLTLSVAVERASTGLWSPTTGG